MKGQALEALLLLVLPDVGMCVWDMPAQGIHVETLHVFLGIVVLYHTGVLVPWFSMRLEAVIIPES